MTQPRVKGQALALVLIVVVVAVVIAFSISSRVVQDIKQQGAERASTRTETIAESAIDNLTLQLQSGKIVPDDTSPEFNISNAPGGLGLCDPNSTDLAKQCDVQSTAKITYYPYVLQFKYFDAENLEIFMTSKDTTVTPNGTNDSGIIIQLYTDHNNSYDTQKSSILIKGFSRKSGELRSVSECVFDIDTPTASTCLPNVLSVAPTACPTLSVVNLAGSTVTIAPPQSPDPENICFKVFVNQVPPTNYRNSYAIDLYRIRPILTKASGYNDVPFVDITVSSNNSGGAFKLPVLHMAMITAGVYSGTGPTEQQVFQQKTRLVLLNKSVPEVADYVLYNGSSNPITK
ncbi:hypothetical protein CO112_01540 [Candidatus Dojkabacteria bacterium CG_4_9_14_3_um_filter_150_Dojkabacteria_WS6_41_13]|uniref:Uncharacterized protein n=1 Tax=Candidatus Dojkabacteria bacterium CG_4_10_14_0_2_um_filter_Dojkabacteria_WS6_41_15 TaxID=2014249 RepID=A0A2M7W1N6_9BACT|nr:MAG: hypothetical protein COZ14_04670 [Candidatus Dojkabacteria bacterium CG_4_10_14_3_um_filter_Dojkabacteria_WS6_41_9]PJA13678.1 MAG: hypothetical protein COX64_03160 [Candidatus Dojkabacteria bacterium CG_4_10_14_0_2_um_filter_Dojkabacteria_WS6_41_15]PJB23132.1 MAG: hypothetical protein CO112_01540 [Candidatus Dojkabacteria bacterium CG_4_9_14_3_um_filter_150_Dojkabacteria_WS6_41_13]